MNQLYSSLFILQRYASFNFLYNFFNYILVYLYYNFSEQDVHLRKIKLYSSLFILQPNAHLVPRSAGGLIIF